MADNFNSVDLGRCQTRIPDNGILPGRLNNAPAGFPSPADDYAENTLDLNEYLIDNPVATFMILVSGDSMVGAGIRDKDVITTKQNGAPAEFLLSDIRHLSAETKAGVAVAVNAGMTLL